MRSDLGAAGDRPLIRAGDGGIRWSRRSRGGMGPECRCGAKKPPPPLPALDMGRPFRPLGDMMKDWIRGRLRALRGRRMARRAPVPTPLGFRFAGPRAMQDGRFEARETEIMRALLKKADLFVNVGANFGYFVCLAQSMGVRAIAVEPVPQNLTLLRKNLKANGFLETTTVHPCACGQTAGQIQIFGVGTGASVVPGWARNPESLATSVDVTPLDVLLAPERISRRTLILCDVEGFELEVLKGATATLSGEDAPVWILETGLTDHRAGGALNAGFLEVFDTLAGHGVTLRPIDNLDRPVTRDQIEDSLKAGQDGIGSINFLLCPQGFDPAELMALRG